MIRSARPLAASVLSVTMLLAAGGPPALAKGGGHGGPGPSPSSTTGNDISWPQCGGSYPSGQAFGIVGLTGGLANDLNSCFGSELAWALGSNGGSTSVPAASLYVNTADPGQVISQIKDWPTNNDSLGVTVHDPYGPCDGTDTPACSWQYGWDRAIGDMEGLVDQAPAGASTQTSDYPWWLDVETGNTWETGTLANNVADLEGMVAAFTSANDWFGVTQTYRGVTLGGATTVGIYSTASQWSTITGGAIGPTSDLVGLPDWIPGARRESDAASNCSLPAFTGGQVLITQWFGHPYDGDVACQS